MNTIRNSYSARSEGEATSGDISAEDWFAINLDKEASAARRPEFEAWLSEPEHAAAYWRVHQLWNMVGRHMDTPRLDELTRKALEGAEGVRRRPAAWQLMGIATVSLVAGLWGGHRFLSEDSPTGVSESAVQLASFDDGPNRSLPLAVSRIQWGARDPSMSDRR